MINGNQRNEPVRRSNRTIDLLLSPVTAAELADWLSLDYDPADDALLDSMLLSACDAYIKLTNREILQRSYTLKLSRTPERQSGYGGLSAMPAASVWWVELPLWPVSSVSSVTIGGDAVTDYTADTDAQPAIVELPWTMEEIVIQYKAGYADSDSVPENVKTGIKMFAAYMYEHRGACDADMTMQKSGAYTMWARDVILLGGL